MRIAEILFTWIQNHSWFMPVIALLSFITWWVIYEFRNALELPNDTENTTT